MSDRTPPQALARPGASFLFSSELETLRDDEGGLVLRQRPARIVRGLVWALGLLAVLMSVILVSGLTGGDTTRFTCSRATGVCLRDGYQNRLPPLGVLAHAELRRRHVTNQGDFYSVTLRARDGTTFDLDSYGAQSEDAVASYRAAVGAINAFLDDPTRATLETSFTYRASLRESLRTASLWLISLVLFGLTLRAWSTRVFTFEPTRMVLASGAPWRRTRYEVPAGEITAVVDRHGRFGAAVALKLTDGSAVLVVQSTAAGAAGATDPLSAKLGSLLRKPIEVMEGG